MQPAILHPYSSQDTPLACCWCQLRWTCKRPQFSATICDLPTPTLRPQLQEKRLLGST